MADEPTKPRPNSRKVREGIAVSAKMDKTVVVAVVDRVRHRRYQKTMQRTKRLYAHDETNDVREGDRVARGRDAPALEEEALARRGSPGACPMIQQESRLKVADNSGAARCSASRCSAVRAGATRASATSSSRR